MAIEKRRDYKDYDDYVKHQCEKTASASLRKRLQNKFNGKVQKFVARFNHLKDDSVIQEGQKVLCLGSRMGEEVAALQNMGLDAVGIDLVPNSPLVIEGDFNSLGEQFDDDSFDAIYTNSFDHAWAADDFFKGVEKVLKKDGIFVIDVFPGEANFARCEVMFIAKALDVENMLCDKYGFELLSKSNKLPKLQRRHAEVQLVFKKK